MLKHDFEYRFREPLAAPEELGGRPPAYRRSVDQGAIIERDVAVPMRDGVKLYADLFRPADEKPAALLIAWGPYGKHSPTNYARQFPTSGVDASKLSAYTAFEAPDPIYWVSQGYAVINVDIRGMWFSEGTATFLSPEEGEDFYDMVEWAGTQPWSNGKVGMLGISYYAGNQWRVAGRHPPHLAAIIPWEGQNDRYRDSGYHGGILCQFQERWAKHQVANIQYGRGEGAKKNPNTGESVAGPVTLSDEELAKHRVDAFEELKKHPLDDEWHRSRSADLSLVRTPLLTCANWGGQGIHPRGNFNG